MIGLYFNDGVFGVIDVLGNAENDIDLDKSPKYDIFKYILVKLLVLLVVLNEYPPFLLQLIDESLVNIRGVLDQLIWVDFRVILLNEFLSLIWVILLIMFLVLNRFKINQELFHNMVHFSIDCIIGLDQFTGLKGIEIYSFLFVPLNVCVRNIWNIR